MRLRTGGDRLRDVVGRIGTIVGATLLLLTAVGSSSARGSSAIPKAAISTGAPIIALAGDGTTVAAVVGSRRTRCGEQTLIWDVRRDTPVVMRGEVDTNGESVNYCRDDTKLHLAVGGGMVGVLRLAVGHHQTYTLSVTRLPTNGRWTDITAASNYSYGAGEGDYLSILGDGPLLAFTRETLCYLYNEGDTCPGVSTDGYWWWSDGRLAKVLPPGSVEAWRMIGKGSSFVGAVALDGGRVITLPPKGQLTIINASSGTSTQLPIPTNKVRQADLDGQNLLILRTKVGGISVLDVRDAATGALQRTFRLSRAPIPARTVHLEDAHSGIVVYRIGTTVHLLRISDGKSHAIVIAGNQGPVLARLEDRGLIYSFSLPGRQPQGRIEFVPLAHLLAQLR